MGDLFLCVDCGSVPLPLIHNNFNPQLNASTSGGLP